MNKFIIVSTAHFPDGDAGAIKYINMEPLFAALGYSSLFIGYGQTPYKVQIKFASGAYVSLRKFHQNGIIGKFVSRLGYLHRIFAYAKKQIRPGDVLVVSPCASLRSCRSLSRFAKRREAKIIFSVVEFFSETEFPLHGALSPIYLNCRHFFKSFRPEDGSILAISSYISHCFETKGINSLVIPFAFSPDYVSAIPHVKKSEKLELMYAGRPGRKDSLVEILKGLDSLTESEKNHLHFSVFGIDNQWAIEQKLSHEIFRFTTFFGQVSNEDVRKAYSYADFSVLLRDADARFAKAGFPTKIAEALWYGVPVITNYSSDLALYLCDGRDSLEVKGSTALAFSLAVRRALKLQESELAEMHVHAKCTAEKKLNIMNFVACFKVFLKRA